MADPSPADLKVAIVVADFYSDIAQGLLDGAVGALGAAGCHDVAVYRAPGSFELPLLCRRAAETGFDAVVALGAVIKGETDHYEHIAEQAASGLMQTSLDTGVPIAFGVLTVRDTEHARRRSAPGASNKGAEAANAAMRAALELRAIG